MPTTRVHPVATAALLLCVVTSLRTSTAAGQGDTTLGVRFGAFADVYYAYDFGRNLDLAPSSEFLYRIEVRGLRATDRNFPDRSTADGLSNKNWVVVSSSALRIQ